MATKQSTVDFLLEQVEDAGSVAARKMFGEYALYCDSKVVALICDDQLFLKPTTIGREVIEKEGELVDEQPAYPGAKPYYLISGDHWDDAEWMSELIRVTAHELPIPKAKKKK